MEPCPAPEEDPYRRPRPDQLSSVYVKGDIDEIKSFELDRLLNKRVVSKGRARTLTVEYLVRWKGYGPEFDQWMSLKELGNADQLVADYEAGITAIRATPAGSSILTESVASTELLRKRGRPRKITQSTT